MGNARNHWLSTVHRAVGPEHDFDVRVFCSGKSVINRRWSLWRKLSASNSTWRNNTMTDTPSTTPEASIENDYYKWSDTFLCWVLAFHIPLQALVAWHFGTGVVFAAGLAALIAAGPLICRILPLPSPITGWLLGIGFMAQSALLIHVSNGLAENCTFLIFVFLAYSHWSLSTDYLCSRHCCCSPYSIFLYAAREPA